MSGVLDMILGSFSFLKNPDTARNLFIHLLMAAVSTGVLIGLDSSQILIVWMMNMGVWLVANAAIDLVENKLF